MSGILVKLSEIGIVPVVKIEDASKAVPLAKALLAGGIPCAEITFRTDAAEESIRSIAREVPEAIVGAGTVLTIEQADKAIDAGARFIVTPGLNPRIVRHCIDRGIPITPGCSTPSDVEQALELGLDTVKFFPAEQSGGLDYLKALAGPYTTVKFMPTGGINADNIAKYLAFDKIVACGGTWMLPAQLISEGRFDEITRLSRQAVQSMLGFELAHVGINAESAQEAEKAARMFETLFGFPVKVGNSSVFADKYVEIMNTTVFGRHGHIAIATSDIRRGKAYLERQGFSFREETLKTDAKGKWTGIYLTEEILGFAIHLLQK